MHFADILNSFPLHTPWPSLQTTGADEFVLPGGLRLMAPTPPRDALEGKAPQRRPQKRLDGRSEEVAKAVGGDYCRLQMPLTLALGVRGQWLGIGWGPWRGGCLAQGLGGCLC